MKGINLYNNFNFRSIKHSKYHYTDNRSGSPMNFIAFMKKGTARIVSDDISINVNEGDMFYIPKNLSYQSYWYGNDEIEFLSFGFLELGIKENHNFKLQIVPSDSYILSKLMNIPIVGNKIDCKTLSIFYDVMSDVVTRLEHSFESSKFMIANKIKQCIQKNPDRTLSEIAAMVGVSEPYLYVLFKNVLNITPNEYRQTCLCNMGIELLITTDKKVEEISRIIHVSSSSYFRKLLKKHTGKTPREIRKSGMV